MSASPYKQLEQEFKRLYAFRGALSLLRWDAAVMMPRGSADVRGEQLAALETEHHALLTAPRITRLLDRAQANSQGLVDWQVANLREHWLLVCGPEKIHDLTRLRLTRQICISANPF